MKVGLIAARRTGRLKGAKIIKDDEPFERLAMPREDAITLCRTKLGSVSFVVRKSSPRRTPDCRIA